MFVCDKSSVTFFFFFTISADTANSNPGRTGHRIMDIVCGEYDIEPDITTSSSDQIGHPFSRKENTMPLGF